ncbi:DNA polymerase kappa isoform X1 [Zootoca vivipara]|uniref:DNA polymerase kappa isoform X1 n=1 Tax=Zootoca vivipara TaxID=8524 RepID=UPI001591CA80|nr:DNA polymerase kappa isoform X1 [Zootoca vivipara]XP_034955388.1 DNA polymerase kappa isoform X1 [Zootoca vivipara]XP_034955389.1 DNA polymerase kappa isoform X1 [Zootoca vivipara]XP_034955390.1 DNA polymerase kappa isoform X1 [Zootoca vivipara]XP_060136217.1 DNA polymerase kappa isoform X1 [Zootoca vivipara]XP_060136218.1 DNA polymerase kappa isoform X1 [Zootoca vivipara]
MENADKGNASPREGLLLRLGLNDNKAGMQGLDKEKINKIIMEASKGSKFYENELKKDQQVNERIEKILKLKSKVTDQQLMKAQIKMDKLAMKLDQSRDLSCTIVHIDMDAFYAAVELRDNPELRDKPIAVGSMSMLSTSNYHARRFGVRAAMPGFIAKKLCPHLTIVPLNFKKYEEVSKEVREILAEYDSHFMPMGLDEAYLNITEYLEERKNWPEDKREHFIKTYNSALNEQQHQQSTTQIKPVVFGASAEEVVEEIRFRIEQKTRLTASAGIAPNTMLAKMCSDKNKPNGQYRIPPEREAVMNFIKDLAIRKVPGIGKVTEKMLKALNIVTCSELYQQRALISLLFSETSWRNFLEISLGLSSTHLERDGERKSMSTERTFNEISAAEQYSLCQELCSDLAQDLKKEGLKARTVTLKLKNVNFEVKTRATTVMSAVSTEEEIFAVAKDLLRSETEAVAPQPLRLRLMGIRVSGFLNEEEKKYQQKSIVNFLEPGKHISTTGLFPRKSEEEFFPNASEKESFFNKKRATRQQTNQAASLNMSPNKQNLQDMKSSVMSVEPAENNGEHQIFICPVCFEEHQDSTLEAFNRHIDRCLSGTLEEDIVDNSKSWQNTTELSVDMEKKECQKDKTSKPQIEVQSADIVDNATNRSTDIFPKLQDDEHSRESECSLSSNFGFDTCAKQDFSSNVLSVEKEEYFEEPSSSEIKLPCFPDATENKVLVCPVCNLEQKTTDLALFNRHVDVCLNKGIIKQLTEESKSLGILDRGQNSTNFTVGTKRSGTVVPQSSSKKAKSNNSKYTIESFFK